MRNWQGKRVTLRQRALRLLGVVSPSGAYPLPPRWAMSKLGRSRYYPEQPNPFDQDWQATDGGMVVAFGDRSVAAGGNIGYVSTGGRSAWAQDFAAGPLPVREPGTHYRVPCGALTRFSTGDPEHTHGWTQNGFCGPVADASAPCFDQQPYVPLKEPEAPC
jgi:hypothetical protein